MTLSPEFLQFITQYTNAILNKINRTVTRKITTTFQDSDEVIPSSKLVKDEFTTVRGEIPTKTSDLTNDSGFLTQHQDITGKEDKSNKVTSLSNNSTDDEYPSAKAVFNECNGLSAGLTNLGNTLNDNTTNIWNTLGPLPSTKQDKTDNNLNTDSKTVVGAINELNTNKQDKITSTQRLSALYVHYSSFVEWLNLPADSNQSDVNDKILSYLLTVRNNKEDKSNKVTSLSGNSTDDQYPSAKAVYSQYTNLASYLGGKITNLETLQIKKSNGDYFLDVGDSQKGQTIVIPKNTSDLTNDSGFLTQHQDISRKEDISNKITYIDSHSTDTEYPSAKAVYDAISNIPQIIFTTTLEDGTTKTYIVFGYEEQQVINNGEQIN